MAQNLPDDSLGIAFQKDLLLAILNSQYKMQTCIWLQYYSSNNYVKFITYTLVLWEIQATPMCWNMCKTFDAELPDSNIDMHNRKLRAGILVPGMFGWLFYTVSFLLHLLLVQVEVTTAMVPTCFVSTSGLSALQEWQNLNRTSSCFRKTKNFGCVYRLLSLINTLWREAIETKQN